MADKLTIMPGVKDGMANIALSETEIRVMLDIIQFAKNTAIILAQQQMALGATGIDSATKLTRMASDAKELMKIITVSVEVGEPKDDAKH